MWWGFYKPLRQDWLFWTTIAAGIAFNVRWAIANEIDWVSLPGLARFAVGLVFTMFQTFVLATVTVGVVRGFREGLKSGDRAARRTRTAPVGPSDA